MWSQVTRTELWTELKVSFAGTIVELRHLRPGQSFTLGEGPAADLTYATPGLHRLVMATADGAVLASLESGELVALGEDERTCVELGPLTIEVHCEPQLVPEIGRRPLDLAWWLSLASTGVVVVALLVLARSLPAAPLSPLEGEAPPYLAYTVRTEPRAAQPRREQPALLPPRAVRHREPTRRAASKDHAASTSGLEPDEGLSDPRSDGARLVAHGGAGARRVSPMLQRDTSSAEQARSAGVLGALSEAGGTEAMVAFAAESFSPEVDDRELWAAMTGGSPDVSLAGLELVGSGRGGGEAGGVIRSGAPARPQARTRVAETQVEGGLDWKLALRFANSLRGAWAVCLRGEDAQVFEVRYSVGGEGRIGRAKISAPQLSSTSRRCIVTAIETHGAGPGPTKNGRTAKVVQRIEVKR